MNLPPGWRQLAFASLIAIPLALLSGAHALSSASLRSAPELALAVFPDNGRAKENLAYRDFAASAVAASGQQPRTAGAERAFEEGRSPYELGTQSAGLTVFAAPVARLAHEAIVLEPLSPRALALLAVAQEDQAKKTALLIGASQVSRRDLILQALVLEQRGAAGDYLGAIGTIDEILRVHPERQAEFFPVLAKALEQPEAVGGFTKLLGRPLPWRDSFLDFAVAQPGVLENLAIVRERIDPDNKEFDRKLILQLAQTGRAKIAERLYRQVARGGDLTSGTMALGWNSEYPPFDWRLADQSGFRAQTGERPETLEIRVTPGNGGVIASRLVRNPERPVTLRMTHAVEPASQIKDVKLAVMCDGQTAPNYEAAFVAGENTFVVDQVPACEYLIISIAARSWTGTRALSGTLSSLRVTVE